MGKVTLSFLYKTDLESLIVKLRSASPHFVRCLKPNPECRAELFHRPSCVEQLRYGGVIEALRVQRSGFPCRQPAEECWKDLRILLTLSQKKALDPKPLNERLKDALKALSESLQWPKDKDGKYEIGKTRVFFKQPAYEVLEGARLDVQARAVVKLQAMVRMSEVYNLFKAIK